MSGQAIRYHAKDPKFFSYDCRFDVSVSCLVVAVYLKNRSVSDPICFHLQFCRGHLAHIRSSCLELIFTSVFFRVLRSPSLRSLVIKLGFLCLHHPSFGGCLVLLGCHRASLWESFFQAPVVLLCFVCAVCSMPVCVFPGAVLPGS